MPGPPTDFQASTTLRELHGREFNGQNDGYMLPADGTEHDRLDLQHEALKLHLQSLYASPALVKEALAVSGEGKQPMVLDVGTGSGRWCVPYR